MRKVRSDNMRCQIKEQVGELLLNTKLSHTEIGLRFGVSRGPIAMLQKELGIQRPNIRIKRSAYCCWCNEEMIASGRCRNRPNRGKYCSKECYRRWQKSEENRGSNHPCWIDGGSHESQLDSLRKTTKWKDWRREVYERDDFTCQMCGERGGILHPHHIYPKRDFLEKIFDIDNGIALCVTCHRSISGREYNYIKQFEAVLMHR